MGSPFRPPRWACRDKPAAIFPAAIAGPLVIIAVLITAPAVAADFPAAAAAGWVTSVPGSTSGNIQAIAAVPGGGYLATGYEETAAGQYRLLVVKTDETGPVRWTIRNSDAACEGNAVAILAGGGAAIAGGGCGGSGGATVTIIATGTGTILHTYEYDTGRNATGTVLLATPDGGFLLAAEEDAAAAGRDVVVRRVSRDGTVLWTKEYTGPTPVTARAAARTPDGGFLIAGSAGNGGEKGSDILLVAFDRDGNAGRVRTFGSGNDEAAQDLLPIADGGYLVAGSSCTRGDAGTCSVYAAGIGRDGSVLWERTFGETATKGRIVAMPDSGGDGYLLAGSGPPADAVSGNRTVRFLQIGDDGRERGTSTSAGPGYRTIGGAVRAPDGSFVIAGSATGGQGAGVPLLAKTGGRDPAAAGGTRQEPAGEQDGGKVTIIVSDAMNGAALSGARVYLDGKLAGSTVAPDGTFTVTTRTTGPHSFRVTRDGYRETTETAGTGTRLAVRLHPSAIHRILGSGTPEQSLDIVFVASNTTCDCTGTAGVPAGRYTGSPDTFLADVRQLVTDRVLRLDRFVTGPSQLPGDYARQLNIYYFWDDSRFADAFSGCPGRLPDGFYDEAPFTDAAVILYPDPAGCTCDPVACTSGPGPGPLVYFKVPATPGMVFLHESGHAMFGLMDTYDGPSYYTENQPSPNIWGTLQNCTQDAQKSGWNASLCRPVSGQPEGGQAGNGNGFWKYDPDPDLMGSTSGTARFGEAATRRIRYILDTLKGG